MSDSGDDLKGSETVDDARYEHAPIQRHPAMQPLSRDHYVGLVQAQRMIKAADGDAVARRAALAGFVDAWAQEIGKHFDDEERLLGALMNEPDKTRLLEEHAALRQVAHEAQEQRQRTDPDAAWARRAGELLRDHIRWEERELFTRIETQADDEALAKLKAKTEVMEAGRARSVCQGKGE